MGKKRSRVDGIRIASPLADDEKREILMLPFAEERKRKRFLSEQMRLISDQLSDLGRRTKT